jgi:hypothetical protein
MKAMTFSLGISQAQKYNKYADATDKEHQAGQAHKYNTVMILWNVNTDGVWIGNTIY